MVWDSRLEKYGIWTHSVKYGFPLINVDDLTELVKQLNEDNWKDPEFMKQFGINNETTIKVIEHYFPHQKVYKILDNLANQILARCIIVANRLTHGIDRESEENIMRLGFGFQKCLEIPRPKIFVGIDEKLMKCSNPENYNLSKKVLKEYPKEIKILNGLVQQAINGDTELLKRLQDLPYLKPKYRLKE